MSRMAWGRGKQGMEEEGVFFFTERRWRESGSLGSRRIDLCLVGLVWPEWWGLRRYPTLWSVGGGKEFGVRI